MERDTNHVNGHNPEEDSAKTSPPVEQELDPEQMKAALQRAQAELINYKRRAEEEKEETLKYASSRVVLKILPVLDEFSLAIAHAESTTARQDPASDGNDHQVSWLEGVRLIHRKLNSVLESELVDRIEAIGKPFDPLEHEAMGYQESTDHPEGHIMSVVREGYKMHGRVIRPALVMLAKQPENRSQQTEDESGQTDSDGKENGNA